MDNKKNFAKVTVDATGYSSAATSVTLLSGHGLKLPTVPFNAVWWNSTDYSDPSDDPNVEVVRVTTVSTDTLTVTRGQESITATSKNTAGKTYKMLAGLTAKDFNTDLSSLGVATATSINGSIIPSSDTLVGRATTDTLTNKTLTAPTIADLTNATHTHQNAAGGGTLNASAIGAGTMATARLGSGTADATTFLRGDQTYAVPSSGAGGSTTQVQFNSSGALAGDAGFTYNLTTDLVTVLGTPGANTRPVFGLSLLNSTAATTGNQQHSGAIIFGAQAFKSTTVAASQQVDGMLYLKGVQGTTAPTAEITLGTRINGGSWTDNFAFTSAGNFNITAVGAVGTPVITLGGILDRGIYARNTSELNFSVGASELLRLYSGTVRSLVGIWISSGGITFGGSGETSIYRSGNNLYVLDEFGTSSVGFAAGVFPVSVTANTTLLLGQAGRYYHNSAASGAVTLTLPTANPNSAYSGVVIAAQTLKFKAAGTDVIRWGSTLSGAAGEIFSSTPGSTIRIYCLVAGTWIAEASEAWTLVAARRGNATLVAGTVTVSNTTVTANTLVMHARKTAGGVMGNLTYTISAGVGFTISSDNVADTSVVSWTLLEIP